LFSLDQESRGRVSHLSLFFPLPAWLIIFIEYWCGHIHLNFLLKEMKQILFIFVCGNFQSVCRSKRRLWLLEQ